jgi:hypothetical protein
MEPALSALCSDQADHAELNTPQPQVAFDPTIHLAFDASGIERVTMSSPSASKDDASAATRQMSKKADLMAGIIQFMVADLLAWQLLFFQRKT